MKLVISEPGKPAVEMESTLKSHMQYIRMDLESRGLTQDQIQRHVYSLSLEMHRVRATNVIDDEGNLIVNYRITR